MASNRSIRNRGRRGKSSVLDLDITSLLDILVILLVFLLKHYNSSGVVINVPEGITLPDSQSKTQNEHGVIVQVSPSKIWVENKVILDTENLPPRTYDHGNRRIIPLFNELVRLKEDVQLTTKSVPEAKPFSGIVNLVVDKSLKYEYLKKLLYTCAEAGYRKYKFVVKGEEG